MSVQIRYMGANHALAPRVARELEGQREGACQCGLARESLGRRLSERPSVVGREAAQMRQPVAARYFGHLGLSNLRPKQVPLGRFEPARPKKGHRADPVDPAESARDGANGDAHFPGQPLSRHRPGKPRGKILLREPHMAR